MLFNIPSCLLSLVDSQFYFLISFLIIKLTFSIIDLVVHVCACTCMGRSSRFNGVQICVTTITIRIPKGSIAPKLPHPVLLESHNPPPLLTITAVFVFFRVSYKWYQVEFGFMRLAFPLTTMPLRFRQMYQQLVLFISEQQSIVCITVYPFTH